MISGGSTRFSLFCVEASQERAEQRRGEYKVGADLNGILEYVRDRYGTEPEFLWAKSPNNAVLRHKESLKWYGVLMYVQKRRLGAENGGSVDILDLKSEPALIGALIDKKGFFPAYHMNMEHWITILLDGTVPEQEVFGLIDLSYDLTER